MVFWDALSIYTAPNFVALMMTSSNWNIFRVTGTLCGECTGHRWIPLTKANDAELWCFLWTALWINGSANNREAGDSRRQGAAYDIIVMYVQHRVLLLLHYEVIKSKHFGRHRPFMQRIYRSPRNTIYHELNRKWLISRTQNVHLCAWNVCL